MGKLMQRVRTTIGAPMPGFRHAEPPRVPREKSTETASQPTASTAAEDLNQSREQLELSEVLPRASAPEKEIDWVALRELANLSAHNAISRYARRMLVNNMYSKLVVAIVALVTGMVLLWMWLQLDTKEITFYSAVMAFFVAAFWGIQYARLTGRLIVNKSGTINIDWNRPNKPDATTKEGKPDTSSKEKKPEATPPATENQEDATPPS